MEILLLLLLLCFYIIINLNNQLPKLMKISKIKIILWLWLLFWITTIFCGLTLALSLGLTHFRYDYNDFIIYAANPCKSYNIITSYHFQNMKVYDILFISLISTATVIQIIQAILLSSIMFCQKQSYIQQNGSSAIKYREVRKKSLSKNSPRAQQLENQNYPRSTSSRISNKLTQINLPKYLVELAAFVTFVLIMTALGHQIRIFVQIFKSQSCMDSKMNQYKNNMYPELIALALACSACAIQMLILVVHHINQKNQQAQNLVYRSRLQNSSNGLQIQLKYKRDYDLDIIEEASHQHLRQHQDFPTEQKLKNPKNLTIAIDSQNSSKQQKNSEQPIKHEPITLRDIHIATPKKSSQIKSNGGYSSSERDKPGSHGKRSYKIFQLQMNQDQYKQYHTIQDNNSSPQSQKRKNRKINSRQFGQNQWS